MKEVREKLKLKENQF